MIDLSNNFLKDKSPGRVPRWIRRSVLSWTAGLTALIVAACGGGGSTGGALAESFSADRSSYLVGEQATLNSRFRGGAGHIDGGIGAVQSGVAVQTPALDVTTTYTLKVSAFDGSLDARSLTLSVSFRNRYQTLQSGARLSGHGAASLPDGSVLLIGGSRGQSTLSNRIDRFDPVSRSVSALATMYEGRSMAKAVVLPDGKVLIGSGITSGLDSRLLELLDPRTGSVTPAGRLSVPRADAATVLLADGRVLFCGGFTSGEGADLGVSQSCDIWDPATRAVRRLASAMTVPRSGHAMTRLRDGRVLISGGYSTVLPYGYAEIFQAAGENFTAISAPVTRMLAQQVAVLHTDGTVLLIGGEKSVGNSFQPTAEVWRFDPATNGFHGLAPLLAPRSLAASVQLRDGRVLLFGGQTEMTRHSAGAERYDVTSGGQAIAPLDQERAYLSANRLPDGRVLVAGGESLEGEFATSLLIYE